MIRSPGSPDSESRRRSTSLSSGREDRHEPALHRQLGGRHGRRLHGRGLGRQLQRAADGGGERRTGAGPLLHRAVLATASRHAPLTLPTPAAAGAVPVSICRLSGLRATARCPSAVEWFTPGTAPARSCDWHAGGGVVLPAEFAEWAQQNAPGIPEAGPGPAPARVPEEGFRILSPQAGDVYRVPAGVDGRYATVGLRAAGATGRTVRWFVDGRAHAGSRWALARGVHRIRAVDGAGRAAEVAISVK